MAEEKADSRISADAGRAYWQGVDADVNGMLGGIPAVTRADLQGSRAFLAKLGIGRKEGLRTLDRVLEGGAGIGRITEGLLLTVSTFVDVVEPIAKFTEKLKSNDGVEKVYNIGLEEWNTDGSGGLGDDETRYDLFWNQWCLGHLTDEQLVQYLQRSIARLKDKDSLIVVKENVLRVGDDLYDELDSSVTRSDEKFRAIFQKAGLRIVKTELQRGMPPDLYPVRMYALRP